MNKSRRDRSQEDPLASRLDSYSTAAGSALSMEARRPRGRGWAAYAAAAGAALAMVPSGEALATLINMDGQGPAEFALNLVQGTYGPTYVWGVAELIPLNSNQAILGSGYWVARFPGSHVVGAATGGTYSWGKPEVLWQGYKYYSYGFYPGSGSGAWGGSQNGFAGVRFQANSQTYFGWIQLHVSTASYVPTAIGLLGFGFNCNPGQPVHVGDTPTCDGGPSVPAPGGLALLAAGAAGLLAWRQRKQEKARES